MYPNMDIAPLVMNFFRTLARWDWRQPLTLLDCAADSVAGSRQSGDEQLDGACGGMTILYPVGDELQSQAAVTDTTMKIMLKELRRGYKIMQQVEVCRAQWGDVYGPTRFFQRHRHYLELDFAASDEEIFHRWLAWADQKLVDFVPIFESTIKNVTLRPWPEMISFRHDDWPYSQAFFVGLHLEHASAVDVRQEDGSPPQRSFDLREPIFKFLEAVSAWPGAQNYRNQFELEIKHVRLAELEQWLENQKQGLPANTKNVQGALQGAWGMEENDENRHCSL
jgi:poly(A) polymerase Pap1